MGPGAPPENDAEMRAPEGLSSQGRGRWDRRDPVEPVEDRERDERRLGPGQEKRERDQRETAEAVVPEEEPAAVVPVGEPPGPDSADDVEGADHCEQPGCRD